MIARVVHEEERARAVDDVGNDERTAECRAVASLEIIGLLRRLAVQRERRRVERRGVEALIDGAADLVPAAAAATERTAKPAAGTSGATGTAESTAPSREAATAGNLARGVAAAECVRQSIGEIVSVGAEEYVVWLRGADRRHRFGRRLRRESRRQQHRRTVRRSGRVIRASSAAVVRHEREALKCLTPSAGLTASSGACAASAAGSSGRRCPRR